MSEKLSNFVPKNILIADARVETREGWSLLLSARGHAVSQVADETALFEVASIISPDVIILGRRAAISEVWPIAAKLRADLSTRDALLIATRGFEYGDHDADARADAYDCYLVEPIDVNTLVCSVEDCKATSRATEPDFGSTSAPTSIQAGETVRSVQSVLIHELSQPLTALQNYERIVAKQCNLNGTDRDNTQAAIEGMQRTTSCLTQMMQLLRDEELWTIEPASGVDRLLQSIVALHQCNSRNSNPITIVRSDSGCFVRHVLSRILFSALMELLGGCRKSAIAIEVVRVNEGKTCLILRVNAASDAGDVVKQTIATWAIKYSSILAMNGANLAMQIHPDGHITCSLVLPSSDNLEGSNNGAAYDYICNR